MIFGINTTSDISNYTYNFTRQILGEWNLKQFWNITSRIYAKSHVQIMLLFVYTTTRTRSVIFTCRYLKLSWNTTALSQSNCRNFSCRSIKVCYWLLVLGTHLSATSQTFGRRRRPTERLGTSVWRHVYDADRLEFGFHLIPVNLFFVWLHLFNM